MGLSRLPGIDRYIARALTGKSTALVRELRATSREPAHTATRRMVPGSFGTDSAA
jgi:hypothetical protein